jgi:hypothetical protein
MTSRRLRQTECNSSKCLPISSRMQSTQWPRYRTVLTYLQCVPSFLMNGYWSAFKIPGLESSPSKPNACSIRFTRPNHTVLGWACQLLARSLSHTMVGCQFRPVSRMARCFRLCYLPPANFCEHPTVSLGCGAATVNWRLLCARCMSILGGGARRRPEFRAGDRISSRTGVRPRRRT